MTKQAVRPNALYNFDQLKDVAANNPDFLKSLASIFLETTPADCAEMVKATETCDWQKVSKYAHKMKSTIDNLNMLSIKTDIRTLETDARNKTNTASLVPLVAKVDRIISEVAKSVKEEFDL